jgi:hypothetical protein
MLVQMYDPPAAARIHYPHDVGMTLSNPEMGKATIECDGIDKTLQPF